MRPGVVRQHPQGHVGLGVLAVLAAGQHLGAGDESGSAHRSPTSNRRPAVRTRSARTRPRYRCRAWAMAPAHLRPGGRRSGRRGSTARYNGPSPPPAGPRRPPSPARGRSRSPSPGRRDRCRPSPRNCPRRCAGYARRHSDLVGPDIGRLVIVGVNRYPQPFGVQPSTSVNSSQAQLDRLGLEIVPEAEVPEHLEERDVLERPPDLVDVVVLAPDPHAFLHAGRPAGRRDFLAQEIRDELVHARIGEQGCPGVVRDEPGRMAPRCGRADKEIHERRAGARSHPSQLPQAPTRRVSETQGHRPG